MSVQQPTKLRVSCRVLQFTMAVWICIAFSAARVVACPFCTALASSLREELSQLDFVALANCKQVAAEDAEFSIHTFEVETVFKSKLLSGKPVFAPGSLVSAYSDKEFANGNKVLMFGIGDSEGVDWAPSEPLAKTALEYIQSVVDLQQKLAGRAAEGGDTEHQWLDLYWRGLASSDSWVQRDAYNAFATVSVEQLQPWVKGVDLGEVKKRLADAETSLSFRRFYWTVLGLAGSREDLDFVKRMVFNPQGKATPGIERDELGLDAAISCYLLLGGKDALRDVTDKILGNKNSEVSARFSTVSALRAHTQEFSVLDKKDICASLAVLLDDSAFADVVIPDLARLEDWRYVSKLSKRFRNIEPHQQYMRLPIINYLRRCPLAPAKEALAEFKKLDPETFRRAEIIFPMPRQSEPTPKP